MVTTAPPVETARQNRPKLHAVSCDGYTATTDALIGDIREGNSHLHMVSLIGTQAAVRILTANIMTDTPRTLLFQQIDPESDDALPTGLVLALKRPKASMWRKRQKQLPLSRAWHTLLWDRRIEPDHPTKDFLLIGGDNETLNARRHLAFLRRKLKLPIHPSWADWAWTRALERNEAEEIAASGLRAWTCQPDEVDLKTDISQAVKTGLLTT